MGEYRFSEHAVWDIKYHLIWITKYRYKILRGGSGGAGPGGHPASMSGAGSEHHPRGDLAGSRSHAGGGSTAVGAGEAGAVYQRAILATVARGVSALAEAILGAAPVGVRVFLRDGRRGG